MKPKKKWSEFLPTMTGVSLDIFLVIESLGKLMKRRFGTINFEQIEIVINNIIELFCKKMNSHIPFKCRLLLCLENENQLSIV